MQVPEAWPNHTQNVGHDQPRERPTSLKWLSWLPWRGTDRWYTKPVNVVILVVLLIVIYVLSIREPPIFDVRANALRMANQQNGTLVTGYVTTATLVTLMDTLLEKRGGYLSNDKMPPWVFLDDMPNFELGVLVQIRDFSHSLRNFFSRSQSQSLENPFLAKADPLFNYDSASWAFPATEVEYKKGAGYLVEYLNSLPKTDQRNAQFYARADNLAQWLGLASKRLGGLSQRLRASVGQKRVDTNLGGDPGAAQSTPIPAESSVKTPWTELDDVFYETRGSCWALIHLLTAIEIDFRTVLEKKNALVSLRQIIRELEPTQDTVWSPVIMNGRGFGLFANHSLVMASYISRANAGLIDLQHLLSAG